MRDDDCKVMLLFNEVQDGTMGQSFQATLHGSIRNGIAHGRVCGASSEDFEIFESRVSWPACGMVKALMANVFMSGCCASAACPASLGS